MQENTRKNQPLSGWVRFTGILTAFLVLAGGCLPRGSDPAALPPPNSAVATTSSSAEPQAPAPGPAAQQAAEPARAPGPASEPASQPAAQPASQPAAQPALVPYAGPIEHLFFHPLILYPELAFDGDSLAQGYDDWFLTVPEFERILADLYRNGYILVDIRELFAEQVVDGRRLVVRKELQLPPGKKPLVISIDDLNYYDYMRANGNAYKLVLDDQQRIATYSVTPDGREIVAYDNDIVPIVGAFVARHPDFSFRGARGLIALTGYEGILGYRTNNPESPEYEQEKAAALAVVKRLKEQGWSFAAHGWGHLDAARASYRTLVRDTARWKAEVEPLVGPTPFYVFPHGSRVAPGDPRFQALLDAGFTVFLGVGPTPYLEENGDHILMDRRHIDGMALRTQAGALAGLFDAAAALDPVRP